MKTISEEASEWFVAFCEQDVSGAGREAFDRWLRASPEHICAYLRISALWEYADLLKAGSRGNIETLVQRALLDSNVVSMNEATSGDALSADLVGQARAAQRHYEAARPSALTTGHDHTTEHSKSVGQPSNPVSTPHGQAPGHRIPAGFWRRVAVAASVLLVTTFAATTLWQQRETVSVYETPNAERRMVALADGSTLQLNARSRVDVRFDKKGRHVDLIEGQALFSVAKNTKRPFIVRANGTQVRAVGTQFDVYRKPGETVVTVVEGQVAVLASSSQSARPHLVSAGEQAKVTSQAPVRIARADITAAIAWSQGRLIFNSTPLREVVAELNRMSPRRLVIEDPSLLDLHISGTFPSNDPTRAVRFLEQRFGVAVQETEVEIRIQRRQTP